MEHDCTVIRRIWEILNRLTPDQLLGEGRVYGGGLHKLEPNELSNVDATAISELIPELQGQRPGKQLSLFEGDKKAPATPYGAGA